MDRVRCGGGSVSEHRPLVRVLVAAPAARAGRAPASLGAGERDRDPVAAPPASRPGAAGRSPAAPGRSGAAGGVQPRAVAAGTAAIVLRNAGDASALAPRDGRAPLDVSAPAIRSPTDCSRGARACGPSCARESGLGLPAGPRRAGGARVKVAASTVWTMLKQSGSSRARGASSRAGRSSSVSRRRASSSATSSLSTRSS
jgi:hypothetical protein